MMLVVGVTGGIGAGKSTVSQMMADLGARVVDADLIAREVLRDDPGLVGELAREFGEDLVAPDGSLDRRELGRRAFRDRRSRERLDRLMHPPILARTRQLLDRIRDQGYDGIVVLDAALLVESRALDLVDRLVVVTAPEKIRQRRLSRGRGLDGEEIRARAAAQLPPGEKTALADEVIVNDGSREDLRRRIREVWNRLSAESGPGRAGTAPGRGE
jgi:dephospho-CoA kinase